MPTVVHCQDSSNAKSERERSYDAHIQYLRTLRDRIRFAGPLAMADGARAQGDENLVGSLFVIDEPASVTFELMQGDPYVKSGVWDRLSVFQAVKAYGPWASGVPLKPPGRLYAALASAAGPPLVAAPAVLFGAELEPRQMRPGELGSAIWRTVAIFSANSLEEARSILVQDTEDRTRQVNSWSLPIAVGTWTRPVQPP
jgi:uncharacterized protein YciI